MKVAILQPAYLPWLGFFELINRCDCFVFLDDVQWTVRDWRNRNRVRTSNGWQWLTVPVKLTKSHYDYQIRDVGIDYSQNWKNKHLETIRHCYKRSAHFEEVYQIIEKSISLNLEFIVELDYRLIFGFCSYLGLGDKKFLFSSEMKLPREMEKNERLVRILKCVKEANTYISGMRAKAYLNEIEFEKNGYGVEWFEYEHPYYNQHNLRSKIFFPYLSVIDLLCNHGSESLEIISGKKVIAKPKGINIVLPDESRRGYRE